MKKQTNNFNQRDKFKEKMDNIIKCMELCQDVLKWENNQDYPYQRYDISEDIIGIPQYSFNYLEFLKYFNENDCNFEVVGYIPFLFTYFKTYMNKCYFLETNLTKILTAVNFSVQYKEDSHLHTIKETLKFLQKEGYINIIGLDNPDEIDTFTPKINFTVCINLSMFYIDGKFSKLKLSNFAHIISNNYRKISNKNLLLVYLNIINQIELNSYYLRNQNPQMFLRLEKLSKSNNIVINDNTLFFGSIGYKRLSKQTKLSVHTVMECVETLEKMKAIYISRGKVTGKNHTNVYALDPVMLSDKNIINDYLEYCI